MAFKPPVDVQRRRMLYNWRALFMGIIVQPGTNTEQFTTNRRRKKDRSSNPMCVTSVPAMHDCIRVWHKDRKRSKT